MKTSKIFAIILSVCLVLCMFSGCGKELPADSTNAAQESIVSSVAEKAEENVSAEKDTSAAAITEEESSESSETTDNTVNSDEEKPTDNNEKEAETVSSSSDLVSVVILATDSDLSETAGNAE